jgi:hypothetical protein
MQKQFVSSSYHGKYTCIDKIEKCNILFDEMIMSEFDFYSASSLRQNSTRRHFAPQGHIILIYRVIALTS